MPQIISIPKPCHEDWNEMTPNEQGRHCDSCAKTVVDFTSWQPQEILFYLRENAKKKVCGRFAETQLNEPIPTPEEFVKQLHYFSMPFLRKIAAIFLFAFSIMAVSCNDNDRGIVGNIMSPVRDTPPPSIVGDSVVVPMPLGAPALKPTDDKNVDPVKCTGNNSTLKGDVMITTPTLGVIAMQPAPPVDTVPEPMIVGKIRMQPDSLETNGFPLGEIAVMPQKPVHKKSKEK